MIDTAHAEQLEAAITEAGLSEEEAQLVRQMVESGELAPDEAIVAAIETRTDGPKPERAFTEASEPSDKQLRDLDKEGARHEERVRAIMGSFVEGFETCAVCSGYGMVPPGEPAPEPQTHPYFKECQTCVGFGKVLTGSRNPQEALRDCPACKGRGYLEALDGSGAPLASGAATALPAPPVSAAPLEQEPQPQPETPAGELHFGTPAWMGDPRIGS